MRYLSFLGLIFIFVSCHRSSDTTNKINEANALIKQIQEKIIFDKRDQIFEVQAIKKANKLVLKGKTDAPQLKKAILKAFKKNQIGFIDSLILLPLDTYKHQVAVTRLSVANLRAYPKHSAELVTQTLMGMPLKIYEKQQGFYHVKTPEGYYAWVDAAGVYLMDQSAFKIWLTQPKIIITSFCGKTYQKPFQTALPVSDIVLNDVFALKEIQDDYALIAYPDGRQAYVNLEDFLPFSQFNSANTLYLSSEDLLIMAKEYLGIPYLWGGTSTKGLDCSGFTKSVFAQAGYLLPRDASQQAKVGKQVNLTPDFKDLQPGDLLFFGQSKNKHSKITHVALHLGNGRIIHATGEVKMESLNKNDLDYNPDRYHSLLYARRILKQIKPQFSQFYTLDCPLLEKH